MTRQQTQNLIDSIISSTTAYDQGYPNIYNAFMAEDCTTIETAVCRIQVSLYNQRLPWKNKLLGLRLLKDLISTASYSFFLIFQMLILPWLVETVRFRHELPLEQKCQQVFLRNRMEDDNEIELIQTGKAVIKLSQQLIKAYALWIPETPYQLQSFPTLFQFQYEQLLQNGVKFPQNLHYFKQSQKQNYLSNYNFKRQTNITDNFSNCIRKRLCQLLGSISKEAKLMMSPSQERCFIQGLIFTGDNHVINTIIDICRGFLTAQGAYRSEATGHIIDVRKILKQFIDWMFALGDPQILYQIRSKIVPLFTMFSYDDKNQYHEGIRKRSRQSLLRFATHVKLVSSIGQYTTQHQIYEAILKNVPLEAPIKNNAQLQQLLKMNLEKRKKINIAKAPMWERQTKQEKQLIDKLNKVLTFSQVGSGMKEKQTKQQLKDSQVSIDLQGSLHSSIKPRKLPSEIQLLSPKNEEKSNLELHSSQKSKLNGSKMGALGGSQLSVLGGSKLSGQQSRKQSISSVNQVNCLSQPSGFSKRSRQFTQIDSLIQLQQPQPIDDDYAEYSSKNSQISRNSVSSTAKMNQTPPTKMEITQKHIQSLAPTNLTYAMLPPADGYVCHPPPTKSKPSFAFGDTLKKTSYVNNSRNTNMTEQMQMLKIQEVHLLSNINTLNH